MSIEALIVSGDVDAVRVLSDVLQELAVATHACADVHAARGIIDKQKLDAVIVDCDDLASGCELIHDIRSGSANRLCVIFAIINGHTSVRTAFDLGANFVLEKPISLERAARSLRAAHGLMLRERRRYLRQPLDVAGLLAVNGTDINVRVVNISEGGVAIQSDTLLREGASVRLQLVFPDGKRIVESRAEVSWTGPGGRAGLHFVYVSEESKQEISRWLIQEFERQEPAALFVNVARGFKKLE